MSIFFCYGIQYLFWPQPQSQDQFRLLVSMQSYLSSCILSNSKSCLQKVSFFIIMKVQAPFSTCTFPMLVYFDIFFQENKLRSTNSINNQLNYIKFFEAIHYFGIKSNRLFALIYHYSLIRSNTIS